jgi:ABC-2 type transport system ATP-binding protein
VIEVKSLTKYYGPVRAVNDISFQVKKGEILGFLGPNAAGKTTTMRMLTCFLKPTYGSATVCGFDIHKDPIEVRRRIGYLPENVPLYSEMRVRPYLHFWAEIKGIPGKKRKAEVDRVAERCGLGNVLSRTTGKLSKGFRQRVGLAQALLGNPEVLILDEPTVGLDPKQIIEVRDLIRSLGGEKTIILSTHILPEVSMTCGRVIIINEGELAAIDSPENLNKRLRKSHRIFMEVAGQCEAVSPLLERIDGVKAVQRSVIKENIFSYTLDTDMEKEIRPELAEAVIRNGFNLLEIRPLEMSLEEIFLKLTTHETGVRGGGGR